MMATATTVIKFKMAVARAHHTYVRKKGTLDFGARCVRVVPSEA